MSNGTGSVGGWGWGWLGQDAAGLAAGFTPADIAGLQLWLKADAGLYTDAAMTTPAVNDADVVGAWADQSGNANHATQATTAKKPLLKLGIVNGQPVVRFDGADDLLDLTGMTHVASDYTFVIAANPTTLVRSWYWDTETGRLLIAHRSETASKIGYYIGTWEAETDTLTGWQIVSFVLASAGGEIFRDGASISTGSYTQKAIGGSVVLGADKTGGSAWFPGDVAEFLIYNTALSAADRQRVEAYLNTRFNVY